MRFKFFLLSIIFFSPLYAYSATKPVQSLPLWNAADTNSSDALLFVNTAQSNLTHRLHLWDLINLPPFSSSSYVLGKTLTGFSPAPGTVSSSDTLLQALNKIVGNEGSVDSGDLTESTSNVLTITGGSDAVLGSGTSIQVKAATDSQSGYMTSSDHTVLSGAVSDISTLQTDVEAAQDDIDAHIADTDGAHADTAISHTPSGTIEATNVGDALFELSAEKTDGPSSSTDGAIALFDGTTGKLLKESLSGVTDTTLGYIANLTSDVQSQLDGKAPATTGTGYQKGDGSGGFTNQDAPIPLADGGTGETTKAAAFDALAPSVAKGSTIVGNGTTNVEDPTCTDGYSRIADSSEPTGWKCLPASLHIGGEKLGSVKYAGDASCEWSRTSNATWGSFSADSDCSTPSSSGETVAAPSTKIPAIVLDEVEPGYSYEFSARADFAPGASQLCSWRFTDGTTASSPGVTGYTGDHSGFISGEIEFPAEATNVQVELQGTGSGVNATCSIVANNATTNPLEITVRKIPLKRSNTTVDIFKAGDYGWKDCTIPVTATTTNPTLPSAAVTSAKCARSGENLKILWTTSWTSNSGGANGSGTYLWGLPSGLSVNSAKVTVNSATTSPAVALPGASFKNYGGSYQYDGIVFAYDSTHLAVKVLGAVTGSGSVAGQLAASSGNSLFTDTLGNVTLYAEIPVIEDGKPWSVFPFTVAAHPMNYAKISGGNPPTVTIGDNSGQSGWLTYNSRTGTGDYTFDLVGYSSAPVGCSCTAHMSPTDAATYCSFKSITSSQIRIFLLRSGTDAAVDNDAEILCPVQQ